MILLLPLALISKHSSLPDHTNIITGPGPSSASLAMVVVRTQIHANLRFFSTITSIPSSTFHFNNIYKNPNRRSSCRVRSSNNNGVISIKAYMENPNSLSSFTNKVIGSLPVIGLVARLFVDIGGVGDDIIDFAEFRRRVGKKCTIMDSRAFYEFQERRGKVGEPLYVLLCCWLAAVGAGLLKSEEILEGVARLSVSDDIEFEEETFIAIMNQAKERRAKMKVASPDIPMEIRVEKALEAIYVCCFNRDPIEEDDERLLRVMLNSVFPSVGQTEIDRIVREKAKKVAEGGEETNYPEPKLISKEAVKLQMKDLEFLQQKSQN